MTSELFRGQLCSFTVENSVSVEKGVPSPYDGSERSVGVPSPYDGSERSVGVPPPYDGSERGCVGVGVGSESDSPISKYCIGRFIKEYKPNTGFITPSFSPSNDRLGSGSGSGSDSVREEEGPDSDSHPRSEPISRMQIRARTAARRIDFSVSPPSTPRRNVSHDVSVRLEPEVGHYETSPVPSHETAESVAAGAAVAAVDGVGVGSCSVCYDILPLCANHVYTMCGHLFCVKCLFKWGKQNLTCPMCRKPLYEDDHADEGDEGDEDDEGDEGDEDHGVVEEDENRDGEDEIDADLQLAREWRRQWRREGGEIIIDESHFEFQDNARNNGWIHYRSGRVRASASFGLNAGAEVMVIGRNVYPAWREQYLIDRFIHDDDEFQWTGIATEDDTIVPITAFEIDTLRISRSLAVIAIRHNIYQTIFLSNQVFNGVIAHSFIPKTEYLHIPINRIGREHFYEFVTCSRESPDPFEPRIAEANVFGFINEMTVVETRDAHFQEDQTWESTHEYCFIVEVFDPLWNDGTYDETDGYINIQQFETRTLRFTDIRRMYSIWGSIRESDA